MLRIKHHFKRQILWREYDKSTKEIVKTEGQKFARVMEEAWLEQDRENALQTVRHVLSI